MNAPASTGCRHRRRDPAWSLVGLTIALHTALVVVAVLVGHGVS